MRIIGIGIDLVPVHRVSLLLSKHGHRLTRRIAPTLPAELSAESLAGRWALREAAVKAARVPLSRVAVGLSYPPSIDDVDGIQFMTSLSHDGGVAVAVVVAFVT